VKTLQSLLQWLDEDPQFRAELRRRLLAEPLIVEIRLPTDWMTRVDERLERLESDVGTLKSDVGTLKSDMETVKRDVETLKRDMGIVKGKVLEVDYRTKAASISASSSATVGMPASSSARNWTKRKQKVWSRLKNLNS